MIKTNQKMIKENIWTHLIHPNSTHTTPQCLGSPHNPVQSSNMMIMMKEQQEKWQGEELIYCLLHVLCINHHMQ